ncbi:vitamin K-dependent gamma-carboxylase isoform X2 [Toxorhynchites rutilus septentrionalis]|uniref:vitamin K-dependent gamma-carboxylase isoform X2 n=1 Tax=Toxorhynchites rutilus septentrionalis TaxID=329112 RepID=UPI00247A5D3F|nr:vitamin K-dependent gamma-carboxylase isoform X2 [Toxorhynchites rutilus septentrionalis]
MVQPADKMSVKLNPNHVHKTHLRGLDWMFDKFCGHDLNSFRSFENFSALLYRRTDGAALGVARIMFGLMMLIDIPEERGGGNLDYRWGDHNGCKFPLIYGMEPPSYPRMGIVYLIMWLGSLGITLGYRYRVSTMMFVTTYWYVFLLDKSAWNNHSYLYGLLGIIFLFTDANRCLNHSTQQDVPFWNYFLLKYQFFILYFLAGLKKMNAEWLSGYAMTNLSYHWVFFPFRLLLGAKFTDLLIIHWFGCIFDTFVVFFLIYAPTRKIATLFACAFHLMNSRLFHIGMFPWVCLAQLPLFYSAHWPRVMLKKPPEWSESVSKTNQLSKKRRMVTCSVLCYCVLQLFLPYSHSLTKGYNNWTNGLYGYSWDMMVHAWDTVLTSIKVVDNAQNQSLYLQPYAFVDNDRWTKHADMAYQFAHCIDRNMREKSGAHQKEASNHSIYFDIWCSLNGRFLQRIFNPEVDILTAKWSPFEPVQWLLPLLHEFTEMRTMIQSVTEDVHSWSNESDVLFVADFPGLTLDNYIVPDMENVTLTILEGSVQYRHADDLKCTPLTKGQSLKMIPPYFHHVKTTSDTPSSMVYTFVNKTMKHEISEGKMADRSQTKSILPLWREFRQRYENYVRFFHHMGNSLLYEIYGVPMPIRVRITPDDNALTLE